MQAEQALANLRNAHDKLAGELMILEVATQGRERGAAYKRQQANAYYAALALRQQIDRISARYNLKGVEEVQI